MLLHAVTVGGIPHWINNIPGMRVRSSNGPWQEEMEHFFTSMVAMAKPFLASNGGPIILAQIENEFHWNDTNYINWCGKLVQQVDAGIPFIMCNGYSASNTINTCNGNDCTKYAESHAVNFPGQPLVWTENEGWFQTWNTKPLTDHDNRSASDMAFVVMKWFARGGAHHNYYMWYGGNNFDRRAAGSCIATEYATGVNLQSDGLANEPKKTHLQRLHIFLSKFGDVLLNTSSQVNNKQTVLVFNSTSGVFVNATEQYAYIYKSYYGAVAFLENSGAATALVKFMNHSFTLPSFSSSLIEMATLSELYNSAKLKSYDLPTQRVYSTLLNNLQWRVWKEASPTELSGNLTTSNHPLEQLNVTADLTDYLFYQTNITGVATGVVDVRIESRVSNAFLAYIDGKFQSSAEFCTHDEGPMNYSLPVNTVMGQLHLLTVLSVSLGVNTHTEPGQFDLKGITGDVFIGSENITSHLWIQRAMLDGERLKVFTASGARTVTWSDNWKQYTNQSLVWYEVIFDAPIVKAYSSLLLDLKGMGRGYIYLNGESLGRYWLTVVGGVYVQRYYTVPQSLLTKTGNLLTLGEELGAVDAGSVQLVQSTMVV